MTFRQTLEKHLAAIQDRDLDRLIETLPAEELLLVMSDGKVARTVREFVEAHRGWFQMPNWTLKTEPINVSETPDMGVAVLRLDYSELNADGTRFHQQSVLTLIFAREDSRWVMVHDQNTPIKGT